MVLLLGLMLTLGISSMSGDSGIVDEVAHIPAGYSYLKFGDYRLNPEHPPLLKDLAALPLLLMNLKFPLDIPAWTAEPNGQWETGWHFIYHIGNNADKILFFARLPILLLALVFGYGIYVFCQSRYGTATALLALFFYTLSPNLLAHARLVTTDLGIAAFMFFALWAFFEFLEKPGKKTLAVAAITFALMQLAKFSAVIMYPFYVLLAAIAILAFKKPSALGKRIWLYGGGLLFIFVAGFLLVWAFYVPHTWNMPADVQDRLIADSLKWGFGQKVARVLAALNDFPGMKSIVQYLLGVVMVFNRVQGGNTTYFLGQVTNQSFALYFPVSYLIKTPIAELLLTFFVLLSGLWRYFQKTPFAVWTKFKNYARTNFVELGLLLFIAFYAFISVKGNLNLGIRHLFPIIPLIFILVSRGAVKFVPGTVLVVLLTWYALANFTIYPSYIAYFNEIIGGPANADKYVTDSNVDWGQDLRRLQTFVQGNKIPKIAVDYFGGGEPKYYFCKHIAPNSRGYDCAGSPYLEWHAEKGRPKTEYIAVSETFLMNDIYWAALRGDEGYSWLRAKKPVAKIGYSIYVYRVK